MKKGKYSSIIFSRQNKTYVKQAQILGQQQAGQQQSQPVDSLASHPSVATQLTDQIDDQFHSPEFLCNPRRGALAPEYMFGGRRGTPCSSSGLQVSYLSTNSVRLGLAKLALN